MSVSNTSVGNIDFLLMAVLVNTAVLGTVGFFSYKHWDARQWDRRVVSAVSVGLLTLWSGEG